MISPLLLRRFADLMPAASFVEIGANDGVQFDPLRPYVEATDWRGVMVEPVPHVFARLERAYGDSDRIRLERAAIAAAAGSRTIHYVDPTAEAPGMPIWSDAVASFDREHVLAELDGVAGAERLLRTVEVPCLTLESLCERHGVERIDLLLIDVEGAELEILDALDLRRWRPRLLVFEHHHLGRDDRERIGQRLATSGYELVAEGLDTWCLDLAPEDELSARWREALGGAG